MLERAQVRVLAQTLARLRSLIGVVALVAPTVVARSWVGAEAATPTSLKVLARALAGRDLALGLAALGASDDDALRTITALGALADGVDLAATALAFDKLPRRWRYVTLASTAGAAVFGGLAAAGLRPKDRGGARRA